MNNLENQNDILQHLLLRCNMSVEDVQSEIKNMRNQKYLENHMYEIWQGADGRWRTHLPDPTAKSERRLIAKSTRESLDKEIIRYYKSIDVQEQAKRVTLREWYQICFAIPFAFQTGLRLGEIVALKESDIDGNYIHVQRMEIRQVEQLENGSWSKQIFTVVDYTKSEAGDRQVYLSKTAKKILAEIISSNRQHGYSDSDFLFLGENGRVHAKSVDYRIRKYCRHIGISEKALHKIRKTYISTLIDSGLNINEIRKLAGHEDERTTYNNFCFNRMTITETENLLEATLN